MISNRLSVLLHARKSIPLVVGALNGITIDVDVVLEMKIWFRREYEPNEKVKLIDLMQCQMNNERLTFS